MLREKHEAAVRMQPSNYVLFYIQTIH